MKLFLIGLLYCIILAIGWAGIVSYCVIPCIHWYHLPLLVVGMIVGIPAAWWWKDYLKRIFDAE